MLFLDSSLELDGITVYRDYNTPSRFYYLPRSPHLAMERGQPMFQLLIYRRDITDNPDFRTGDRPGGGFLTMTVDLGVPQATLDAIKQKLSSRAGGDVDLAPVPFEDGSVRVSTLGVESGAAAPEGGETAGPRFVERILGAARPSLYGDNRCVFSIELSHEGAQLMRASLEDGGASQIAVVYSLDFRGLLPAYEARITINFRQSYSHLRSRLTANTLWFRADIDNEVERLTKEGAIRIEEVDYMLGADPARLVERAQRLTQLARDLAQWSFFKPGLEPGRVLAPRDVITAADPTAAAEANRAGFTEPLAAVATGVGSPGGTAGPRVPGEAAAPAETRADGTALPAAGPGTGTGTTGTPGTAPTAVEAWNRAGRPQAAYALRTLSQEEQQTITFDLRQIAAQKRTVAPQGSIRALGNATALRGRIKEVDLNDPFFQKIAGTVTTSANLEEAGVSSLVVKIRYGTRPDGSAPQDATEFSLARTGDRGVYEFFLDRAKTMELEYQVVVNYRAGFAIGSSEVQASTAWIRTSTRNLDVDPRILGAVMPVTVTLGGVDWNSVRSVQSTFIYDDARGQVHAEKSFVLTRERPDERIVVRPKDPAARKYRVRTIWFYGDVQETTEVERDGDALVVLNPPVARAIPVAITATDPMGRFRKVTVELAYADQTRLVELAGDGASASWTFFRPNEAAEPRYRYRVTLFGTDGTTDVGPWMDTLERQLIVGDRFEGMLQVEAIVLVPDFASAGFMGAKVKLDYPEAPAGADPDVERFFTGVPSPFTWRVPRKRGGSRQYRYTVQWIRTDRSVTTVGPETTDAETLLILPPG